MKLSNYLFAFFVLFVIFADEMFISFVAFQGMTLGSGMRSVMAMVISVIGYFLILKDLLYQGIKKNNYKIFVALIIILILYLLTSLFYQPSIHLYWAELLVYGSMSVPACYVGMRLARKNYTEEMMGLLPFFVAIVAAFVSRAAISASMSGMLLGRDDYENFGYQSSSYFLAFSYAYSFFYVFFYSNKKNRNTMYRDIVYMLMIILMLTCAIGGLVGGGRGAFIYMIIITAYFLYRLLFKGGKRKISYIFLLVAVVFLILYLFSRFNLSESTGFLRVKENLITDNAREGLWKHAISAFYESPVIGNGLGSVWWKVGFRSHNLLSDLLVEAGVLGALIGVFILINALIKLFKWAKVNSIDMFILIVFLGSLVNDIFSGYWIASYKMFFVIGYVFSKPKNMTGELKLQRFNEF